MRRRILGVVAVILVFVVTYASALVAVRGRVTAARIVTMGFPTNQTWHSFPQRQVEATGSGRALPRATTPLTGSVTYQHLGLEPTTTTWDELFRSTGTTAFLVIRDGRVVHEAYPNGGSVEQPQIGFSVTKSFVSTLIGIAIDQRRIASVDEPVISYLPELRGRGLDTFTVRDLLRMNSGIDYSMAADTFPLAAPFGDEALSFYSDDLRAVALSRKAGAEPIGKFFRYNDFHLDLEGLILERVTGMSVSAYLKNEIWDPLGMQFPGSWSLDSTEDGFEKMEGGLAATAMDFARLGLLYLNDGRVGDRQVVPTAWVDAATRPDPTDHRPWKYAPSWPQAGGYYGYHWWGRTFPDGGYDYMARGHLGQLIYVSPASRTVIVRLGNGPEPDGTWPFVARALIESGT